MHEFYSQILIMSISHFQLILFDIIGSIYFFVHQKIVMDNILVEKDNTNEIDGELLENKSRKMSYCTSDKNLKI